MIEPSMNGTVRPAALIRDKGGLRLAFHLDVDDLVAFGLYTQWSSPERRGFRWFAMAIPLLVVVVMTFSVPAAARVTTVHILFLVLCGVGFFLTPRWVRYRIGWRIRRQARLNKGQTGEMLYELSPAGFVVQGPKGRTKLPKGAYFFARETDKHLFFFVQDKAAYVLPKAAFSSGELDEIRGAAETLTRASKHA